MNTEQLFFTILLWMSPLLLGYILNEIFLSIDAYKRIARPK